MKKLSLIILVAVSTVSFGQQAQYGVIPGNGNGLLFWQSDTYKIHMGSGPEYFYGPVSDYSIKTNMSNDAGRGWTWGVVGQTPVAAINTGGNMQIAGSFNATGQIKMGGVGIITQGGENVHANLRVIRNTSSVNQDGMYIGFNGSGGPLRFFSNSGTTEFMTLATSGNLGIGTTTPSHKLQVSGGEIALDEDRSLRGGGSALISGNSTQVTVGAATPGTGLRFDAGEASRMFINATTGNVGIGTSNPNQKLTVNGMIYGKEVKVNLSVPAPDYVFEEDYKLRPLEALERYLQANKHLPEVPSGKEMEADGIDMGAMEMILLKKVEELTLYIIAQQKQLDAQREEIRSLKAHQK